MVEKVDDESTDALDLIEGGTEPGSAVDLESGDEGAASTARSGELVSSCCKLGTVGTPLALLGTGRRNLIVELRMRRSKARELPSLCLVDAITELEADLAILVLTATAIESSEDEEVPEEPKLGDLVIPTAGTISEVCLVVIRISSLLLGVK